MAQNQNDEEVKAAFDAQRYRTENSIKWTARELVEIYYSLHPDQRKIIHQIACELGYYNSLMKLRAEKEAKAFHQLIDFSQEPAPCGPEMILHPEYTD